MGEAPKDPKPPAKERGFKNYRLTPAEKRGRAAADQTNWRTKIQASKLKFDDKQKQVYLDELAKNGRRGHAAMAANVSMQTVARHREEDPLFEEGVQAALQDYADKVHTLATKLMEGVDKPLIGGKDKDEIVAYEKVYATNLLAMEMRRTDPSYKERSEVDVNHGGGVMVAPAGVTPEEFIKQEAARNANKAEPGSEEGKH